MNKFHPIYVARARLGLSQAALAKRAHTDQGFISRLEKGVVKCSPAMAEKIAKVLAISEEMVLYPSRFLPGARLPSKLEPKGWKLVRNRIAPEQVEAVQKCMKANTSINVLWAELLAAAPKYKAGKK